MAYISGAVFATGGTIEAEPQKFTATVIEGNPNAGSVTLGTVGAGKKWRIITITCGGNATAGSNAYVSLNGVVALEVYFTANAGAESGVYYQYDACPVLTAGQTVVATAGANAAGHANVAYVEEDA